MAPEHHSRALHDPKFIEGHERVRSARLEAKLAPAKADYERRHPERNRVIEEAKRRRQHPFLLIAAFNGDKGARPLPSGKAIHNISIAVFALDETGKPKGGSVVTVKPGRPYQVQCIVQNLGTVPALIGIAEFYALTPADFNKAATIPGVRLRALGYAGFTAPKGKPVTIHCKNPWTPTAEQAANASVLVQVYDPTTDFVSHRFDAAADRHVGRFDFTAVPDFTSTWLGGYFGVLGKEPGLTMVITQKGSDLSAKITVEGIASTQNATGSVSGQQAMLKSSGPLGSKHPQTTSQWKLSFTDATTLSVQHEFTDTQTPQKKFTGKGTLFRQ